MVLPPPLDLVKAVLKGRMAIWGIVGVIVSILTLAASILFHLFKTTWWMATLTATLNSLNGSVEDIKKVMARYEAIRYTTEDAARDFTLRDKQIEAMWKRIDEFVGKKGA